jgi:2-desacetyl-2-hydroxyethyl bacteriochlorophyllide A dehydrogenase
MQIQQIVVTGQNEVELQEGAIDADRLGPEQILVRTERSFISAGTELANYTGADPTVFVTGSWNAYPWRSGYANVGTVVAAGSAVQRVRVGERVFSFGPHASHHIYDTRRLVAALPDDISSEIGAAMRMAHVAMTATDVAQTSAGRWVAVFGLGTVGNLAAQLFGALGAKVIGVDPAAHRRDLAQRCGIPHVVGGSDAEVQERIRELTGGQLATITVDAVGHSAVVMQCLQATASFGETILLGSPRVAVQGDLTELLRPIHWRWVTLKGALEWRVPAYHQLENEHSQLKKHGVIVDWLRSGRITLAPLISHRLPPAAIKQAYEGLLREKDSYVGVVLEWQ